MSEHRVVVVGSGALSQAICYSMASSLGMPASISVIARSPSKTGEISYIANVRAALSRVPVTFNPVSLDLSLPGRSHRSWAASLPPPFSIALHISLPGSA